MDWSTVIGVLKCIFMGVFLLFFSFWTLYQKNRTRFTIIYL